MFCGTWKIVGRFFLKGHLFQTIMTFSCNHKWTFISQTFTFSWFLVKKKKQNIVAFVQITPSVMKIAKMPPGSAGTDANSHGLQVSFEDFENSCFAILSRRLLLTKRFGDNLAVIWPSWPTWINRSTNLFPTLPWGTHASLPPGLPPLQWVCSPAGHGKCETVSWNTFCFLTIIIHIPGQCCGQVGALLRGSPQMDLSSTQTLSWTCPS